MLAYVGERAVLRSPTYRRIPRRPVIAAIEFTSLREAVVALVRRSNVAQPSIRWRFASPILHARCAGILSG
jgi:hypothetical protein